MTQKERKELCEKDFEKIDDTEFDFSDISEAVPVNMEDKENFDNISEEDKKKIMNRFLYNASFSKSFPNISGADMTDEEKNNKLDVLIKNIDEIIKKVETKTTYKYGIDYIKPIRLN